MVRTPLYDKFTAAGVRTGEYCGAETAAAFSGPRPEYFALRTGCGVYDLGWRAKIVATGKDRTRWLNGMVSNNIRDLAIGCGTYNFVLNPQGRILGDLYVYNRGEDFLLDTDRAQAADLAALLQRYIIMDKVELADTSDRLTAVGVQGPLSPEALAKAGFQVPQLEPTQLENATWQNISVTVTRVASGDLLTYEVCTSPEHVGRVWDALVAAGATPVGTDALEMSRIAAGVPRYGQDIRERDLPQETGQMQALSFTKGCYLGQEIVERIRSRGAVHRTLAGFIAEEGRPEPGAKLQRDGKEVGELTSVRAVPADNGDRILALGYVRREAGAPGTTLDASGAKVKVEGLPFKL